MTKKKFIRLGLLAIALRPLLLTIMVYLSFHHSLDLNNPWMTTIALLCTPVVFGVLASKRLRYLGKSNAKTTLYMVGYLAAISAAAIFAADIFFKINTIGLSLAGDVGTEAAAWGKSGAHGEFQISGLLTLKYMAVTMVTSILYNWLYFLMLFVGAQDPRTSSRLSVLAQFANRIKDKFNSVANTANQKLA